MTQQLNARPEFRQHVRKKLEDEFFDLIIIGGGISGAGVARDAVLRGLKTLLLEKDDFASGASSRSSRMVHGGLRYVANLQFGLVRDSLRERFILHRIAPHLVRPQRFMFPHSGQHIRRHVCEFRLAGL